MILVVYVLVIAAAVIGAFKVEVQFDIEYFVSERSQIYGWYQANDEYFSRGLSGERTMTYIESDVIEWSTEANQLKLIKFN